MYKGQQVRLLKRNGLGIKKIARQLGMSKNTVKKYLKTADPPFFNRTIRLRVVSTPSQPLKVLLQKMKILLPSRPRIIENVVQKNAPCRTQVSVIA